MKLWSDGFKSHAPFLDLLQHKYEMAREEADVLPTRKNIAEKEKLLAEIKKQIS
jgi:hypothetical protein